MSFCENNTDILTGNAIFCIITWPQSI